MYNQGLSIPDRPSIYTTFVVEVPVLFELMGNTTFILPEEVQQEEQHKAAHEKNVNM